MEVCPKTWAYITSNLGWHKVSAETNMGPQDNMYLSAPAIAFNLLFMGTGRTRTRTLVS